MQDMNEWLRLPDDQSLEAGEDSNEEDPEESNRFSWVPPRLDPRAQAKSVDRNTRPHRADGPVKFYSEEARGQPIFELFEGPDDRLMNRDPENG
ncbi:MAG TPA: hypothetical protein VNV63_00220, partial [Nitrospiria bacterium]|nr:hypothetical protein [Nitrospiria bacterium]